jgi:hypothetical protein
MGELDEWPPGFHGIASSLRLFGQSTDKVPESFRQVWTIFDGQGDKIRC